MAKKPTDAAKATPIELPQTQRAYTLRLRGVDPQDNPSRDGRGDQLGVKVFGDCLHTLRDQHCLLNSVK